MSVEVANARQEWEESYRRLEATARDRVRYERLLEQVSAITDELRRRVGPTFTLAQLADVYAGVERWSSDAVAATTPPPGWLSTVSLAEGAAFHLYARGAVDFRP